MFGALNSGDSPASRIKASITRSVNAGVKAPKPPKVKMAKVPHDGDLGDASKPKLRAYKGTKKFLGSFKYGGPVHRTGVYLLHKGEHVKSPFNRRRG